MRRKYSAFCLIVKNIFASRPHNSQKAIQNENITKISHNLLVNYISFFIFTYRRVAFEISHNIH